MFKKKLISFDLDQTLVNTAKAHALSFKRAFSNQGMNIDKKRIFKFIDGRHSKEVILSIAKTINKKLTEKQIEKIRDLHHFYLKKTVKYAKPIKDSSKTLKKLKKNYKLALLTNCSKEEANLLLEASKISKKIFSTIVLADQVKHPKPFPDEIVLAEHLLHVKSDIHVGDSIFDIIAAKKAKAISIAVLTGQASRNKLKKYHPDYILKSVADLPRLLRDKKLS